MLEMPVPANVESDQKIDRRIEEVMALLTAPPEALEAISQALTIYEEEKDWRKTITKLQTLYDVPIVGRIAKGVGHLLVGNLVARRTQRLNYRGVKPYTGPPPGAPIE